MKSKALRSVKVGDIIYLEGIDLTSTDNQNWLPLERCADEKPAQIEGIGFVVAVNHETISLATLRATDKDSTFGIIAVVPKGCIKKIYTIYKSKK